jgi:NTE family protein
MGVPLPARVIAPWRAPLSSPCRLLSLSGGGSWGAFESGVVARIVDERDASFDYDRLLGVSAGSMNAGLLATQAPGNVGLRAGVATLKTLWSEMRTRDVWHFAPLGAVDVRADRRALLSTEPLRALLARELDGRVIRRNLTVGVTSLASGRPMVVDEVELRRDPKFLQTVLLASSAIPVLFPPVAYNHSLFVDGGIGANVLTVHGVEKCPRGAPVELDVVNVLPLLGALAEPQLESLSLLNLALRSVQVLLSSALNHQLDFKCAPGERSNVLARVYTPSARLGIVVPTVLDFDWGAELWQAGYETTTPMEFYFCT